MGLARACGGATGRVVQGIAASMKGTAFTRRDLSSVVLLRPQVDPEWLLHKSLLALQNLIVGDDPDVSLPRLSPVKQLHVTLAQPSD